MKKFTKSLCAIALLQAVVLLFGGCGNMSFGKSDKDIMMKYMEDKYGEQFEFISIGTQTSSSGRIEMWVQPKEKRDGIEQSPVCVKMPRGDKGSNCSDNYICYLMSSQMDEFVYSTAKEIYGENQVFPLIGTAGMLMPASVNKETSFEDYIKSPNLPSYSIYIASDYSLRDQHVESFRLALAEKQCALTFTILYVDSADEIGGITREKRRQNMKGGWRSQHVTADCYFIMKADFQFDEPAKWRELT
jgi:hypothetical protein